MKGQVSKRGKVYVGMSGGVDSSVSAALLKRAGYEVTGVFIKVWTPPFLNCTWRDDRLDAMRVCAHLGIPFVTLDLEKEYKREVVDYMLREYKAGRTPNPDVMCNRHIKFGGFFKWVREHEPIALIATGHYARVREITNHKLQFTNKSQIQNSKLQTRKYELLAGVDADKDQSYFLWTLTQNELARTLFPVGGMQKSEVRQLAKKFGLPTAEKKDSQGLCFLGKVDMKEFLKHFIKTKRGSVLDEKGEAIGTHDGVVLYTIGERIGFAAQNPPRRTECTQKNADKNQKPYYVVDKNISENTVTVAHKLPTGEIACAVREVLLREVSWVGDAPANDSAAGASFSARVRYRQPLQEVRIMNYELRIMNKKKTNNTGSLAIQFYKPQIAASGQSVVFYDGEVCVGGGIIA